MSERFFTTGEGRVFMQRYSGGPSHPTTYLGCHAVGEYDKAEGDITPVWCPDPSAYGRYKVVGTIRGEEGLPTTSIVGRFGLSNPIMDVKCPMDLHVHFGKCGKPTDFDGGWEVKWLFNEAALTNKSSDPLASMTPGDESEILLTGDITAMNAYLLKRLSLTQKAAAYIMLEAVDVVICDAVSCGECGDASDGCENIYIAVVGSGLASPGYPAEIVYSEDGGVTWADEDIDTMATDEDPTALQCIGDLLVVVSYDSDSIHYANLSDLDTWTEQNEGFLLVGSPRAIWAYDPNNIWIVGDAGYIYFSQLIENGVGVQNAGDATNNALHSVHGLTADLVVAVGAATTVVYTEDGVNWILAAGAGLPAATVLNVVWVFNEFTWFVGAADGRLYYTLDKGANWVEKEFVGCGTGQVRDIVFTPENGSSVGYLAHDLAAGPAGRMFRSTNGGYSWEMMPYGPSTIPENDVINALAVCADPDFVVGVGLGADGADGIALIGA